MAQVILGAEALKVGNVAQSSAGASSYISRKHSCQHEPVLEISNDPVKN